MKWPSKTSLSSLKSKVNDVKEVAIFKSSEINVSGSIGRAKEFAIDTTGKTIEIAKETTDKTKKVTTTQYADAKGKVNESLDSISNIDWEEVKDLDKQISRLHEYKDMAADKAVNYFQSTFETDKDTAEIVNGIKNKLPIPADNVDDIFEQCKGEAMRRATAAFFLTGTAANIDSSSEEKYSNLSESFKDFKDRVGEHSLTDSPNYSDMRNQRRDAQDSFSTLENGYNQGEKLYPHDVDIEHVISKKEYFGDTLLKAGTTDDEIISALNSQENLVFADASLNRSLGANNIFEYLDDRGAPHSDNPDLIDVEIQGKVVTVSRKSVEESVEQAENNRQSHGLDAAKEIGNTMVNTGATIAVQQVVGMIIVETIDVFIEELNLFVNEFKLVSTDGLIKDTKQATLRIQTKLNQRFEERDIWARAKTLGIGAGVSGALSVIPQIIISTMIKMPAFMLSIVREGTLSLVRCIRILSSDESNKLDAVKVIMLATASAVVGLYISRILSNAIAAVPLLNRFNSQVSSVLTGLLLIAIPLTAIYAFDKNKDKLSFSFKKPNELAFN